MNKERIDRLFEMLNLGDVDEDKMMQEFQDFFSIEDFYNEEELVEKVGNFMQDIEESGLIDYFLSKQKENKENKFVRDILCRDFYAFISDVTILDKLIENSEEYGLEQYNITDLLENITDLLEGIGDARIYKRMDRKLERRQKNK